ncbi:MAG: phosphotransferase [Candidatus Hydrogenedentota bacterium]
MLFAKGSAVENNRIKDISDQIARMSFWSGPVSPQPLPGGITNTNFVVHDGAEKYVVRIGDDLPLHGILRTHEVSASRAAHAADLAPEIVHHESGVLVMRFIEGSTLTAQGIANEETLERLAALLRGCHTRMKNHLHGATPMFWVFQVCRNYLQSARNGESRVANQLDRLDAMNVEFEEAVGAIEPVFCHNDLLPANFIDDGERIWLIDWEYAGWNSALFDLANLSSNCELTSKFENHLLKTYYGRDVDPQTIHRFRAFRCASLLRETLWSVVQEIYSQLDFDYAAYSDEQFARLEKAYSKYKD